MDSWRRRAAHRIALVVHEGDIGGDADEATQWGGAAKSLHELDGIVPYVLKNENHDYRTGRPAYRPQYVDEPVLPRARFRGERLVQRNV